MFVTSTKRERERERKVRELIKHLMRAAFQSRKTRL